jgi:hypothetical protein
MTMKKVTTESGSRYYIDEERHLWLKIPARDNPWWFLENNQWYRYWDIEGLEVGASLSTTHPEYWITRTTPIVSIEDVDGVEEGPDE